MEPAGFEACRNHFLITKQFAYFDHAAVGPMPDESVQAMVVAAKSQAEEASGAYECFLREVESTRRWGTRPGTSQPALAAGSASPDAERAHLLRLRQEGMVT